MPLNKILPSLKLKLLLVFIALNFSSFSQVSIQNCCDCLESGGTQATCESGCGPQASPTYTYADCPINTDLYFLLGGAILLGAFTIARKQII